MKLLNVKKLCACLLGAAMISSVAFGVQAKAGETIISRYGSDFSNDWECSKSISFDNGKTGKWIWGFDERPWYSCDQDYSKVRCTGYFTYRSEVIEGGDYWDNYERLDNEWCNTYVNHYSNNVCYRAHFFTPARLY